MIVRNWIARGSSVFLAALLLSGCSVQMPEKDGASPVPEKPEFVEELPAEPELEELPVPEEPEAEPIPEPEPEPEPQPITATLAVCGDVMSHKPLIDDTLDPETGLYDYTRVMAAAMPYVSSADYAVANFETTMAGGPNYTGYPCFNAPDNLAETLKDIGFDLMLTANNHSLDKGFKGLCRTLDVLDEVGLAHVGTSRTQEEQDNNLYVADVGGISVAFLGWTYGTNGISLPKAGPFSVNIFNTDYLTTLSTPDWEAMAAELEKARALETDLIAVMIHWGVEYKNDPNRYQEQMADFLLKQGVDIVLGGHSHVPQPVRMQTVTMEDGSEHAGLVSYSLGNFISAQDYDMTDTTAVFTLELMKDPVTEETSVIGWSYRPMMMLDREEGPERYELLDIYEQLAREDPDAVLKAKLENALATCHRVWGAEYDAVAAERTETPAEIG